MNTVLKYPIYNENYFYCPYCKRAEKKLNSEINIYINIQDEEIKKDFIHLLLIMFIQILFNYSLFFTIFIIFYLSRIKNDALSDEKISNEKLDLCRKLLITGFILLMSITYMTFFYSLFLFIFILSIPFKLYPIKYYF